MAGNEVATKFSTSGHEDVVDAYEDFEEAIDKQTEATGRSEAAQRRLDGIVRGIQRRNETAAQRAKRLQDQANQAFQDGKIDADLYKKELEKIDEEMEQATGRFKSFADQQDESFSLTKIQGYIGQIGAVMAAWQAVKQVVEEINARAEAGQELSREGASGVGLLRQLAGGDQSEFDRLTQASRDFAATTGQTLDEAARAVFSINSAGLADQTDLFAQLVKQGLFGEASSAIEAVAAQANAFGDEVGSVEQIIAKGLVAAGRGLTSLEGVLGAGADVGGTASTFGLSDEETSAALSTLTKVTKSAELARTQLESLLSGAAKGGIEFESITQLVADLNDRQLGFAELSKTLGRKEGAKALLSLVQNFGEFQSILSETQQANADASGIIERTLGLADPFTDAARGTDIDERRSQLLAEAEGSFKSIYERQLQRDRDANIEQFGASGGAVVNVIGRVGGAINNAADFVFGRGSFEGRVQSLQETTGLDADLAREFRAAQQQQERFEQERSRQASVQRDLMLQELQRLNERPNNGGLVGTGR